MGRDRTWSGRCALFVSRLFVFVYARFMFWEIPVLFCGLSYIDGGCSANCREFNVPVFKYIFRSWIFKIFINLGLFFCIRMIFIVFFYDDYKGWSLVTSCVYIESFLQFNYCWWLCLIRVEILKSYHIKKKALTSSFTHHTSL